MFTSLVVLYKMTKLASGNESGNYVILFFHNMITQTLQYFFFLHTRRSKYFFRQRTKTWLTFFAVRATSGQDLKFVLAL